MSRLDDALALVAVSSVSRDESRLASAVESALAKNGALEVVRIGDNVVARTSNNRAHRVIVAGHLDTVPGDAALAKVVGDRLEGVGACDMKGSLAVMIELATDPVERSVDVTWVFYAREEIVRSESGLLEIAELRPDLLVADVAVLAEPTGGVVEAGCQGTLRLELVLRGQRAHTARPFTGRNALHRLGPVLNTIAAYEPRVVTIDGVTYTEQLQAVLIEGGIAANVVPDEVRCTLNHRVAPDRTLDEAFASVRSLVSGQLEATDELTVVDWAPAAAPALSNERLAKLVQLTGQPARGKVGWTDVATFGERGVPATNFGAGDPLLAHRADEFVTESELDEFARVLKLWLS